MRAQGCRERLEGEEEEKTRGKKHVQSLVKKKKKEAEEKPDSVDGGEESGKPVSLNDLAETCRV